MNFDMHAVTCLLVVKLVTSNAHDGRSNRAGLAGSFGQCCSSILCTSAALFSLMIGLHTICCFGLSSGSNDCLLSGLLLISRLKTVLDLN